MIIVILKIRIKIIKIDDVEYPIPFSKHSIK